MIASTFSFPTASTVRYATTAESMPPLSPMTAPDAPDSFIRARMNAAIVSLV